MHNRLKGFTLIELIVVLLISSLLIFISLSTFFNFNNYLNRNLKEEQTANELFWFISHFKDDIERSQFIEGNSEILRLHFEGHTDIYEIYKNKVVRYNQNVSDTVHIDVKEIDVKHILPGFVDYISIKFNCNGVNYSFIQNKTYSNSFLFIQKRKN